MEIQYVTIKEITKIKLKPLIADFKDKFEERMLSKFFNLPTSLSDLAVEIHKQ